MILFNKTARRLLLVFYTLVGCCLALPAYAGPDVSQPGAAVAGFDKFIGRITSLSNAAINQPDFTMFVKMMFFFFVLLMIIWTMWRYSMKAVNNIDILTNVILILMVQVLMTTYVTLIDATWSATEGIAGSLQMGMIGTRDAFFAPAFITNVLSNMYFPPSTWLNPVVVMVTALNMTILSVLLVLLSVLSYVAVLWGFWGYTLAKLTGMLFLPFLLYERLSFLFDGWLRFYFGFLIYYIMARLNVVMVACSLAIFLGVSIPFGLTPGVPVELPMMASLFDAIGVTTFVFVGLLSLFSTGKFAATIVSGAGGGGMGSAVMGAARAAAKMTML